MRLLQRDGAGRYRLEKFTGDDVVPCYAILSHTWGSDNDEVTFADLENGTRTHIVGYRKLDFCAEQAAKDNLQYFWVDTCCIDKSSSAELEEAIASMFAWYRGAAVCYVYLSDVSLASITITSSQPTLQGWHAISQQIRWLTQGPMSQGSASASITVVSKRRSDEKGWYPAFQQSRWFTRGWTLQELIAPASVEFFSVDGHHLGSKHSLLEELHHITGIGVEALQAGSQPEFNFNEKFTFEERMSWMDKRQTKIKEDMAYSLLGIFDVHMVLIYGEGRDKALARLKREYLITSSDAGRSPALQVPMSQNQSTYMYHGPVFNGPVTGRNVITGMHVTGGTVNFNFK
jgi:hypothetical protein